MIDVSAQSIEFITSLLDLFEDEKQRTYFEGVINSLKEARENADSEEKFARLDDAAIKFANQAAFIIFRANKLTEEANAKLRELPTPEASSEIVRKFEQARQERIDAINEQHKAIFAEQKELDVFTGIIAGMSKEDAQKRMEEHEKQVREAAKAQQ